MKWWRELNETGPDGFSLLDVIAWVAAFFAITLMLPALVALALSFIVPVEPWVAVLAVLAGWPIQWRLVPVLMGTAFAVGVVGAGAAWVIAAFVADRLLGPVPALVVIIAASPITVWAIGWLEDSKAAADDAARYERDLQEYRRKATAVSPGGPRRPSPS